MSDSFGLNINFFNSVPKKQTKYFTVDNITVKFNSSEQDFRSLSKNFESLNTLLVEFFNL